MDWPRATERGLRIGLRIRKCFVGPAIKFSRWVDVYVRPFLGGSPTGFFFDRLGGAINCSLEINEGNSD